MRNRRRVIVTGGAGFIGAHLSRRLLSEGYKVTVLDNLFTGKKENIPQGADFIKIDLGKETARSILGKIRGDAIFHLAGQSSGEASFVDPLYDFRSHVASTFRLLDWCKNKGIPRFLYASSMSVYGDPDYLPLDEKHPLRPKTFYAAGKIAAEAYIKLYQGLGINTTILRLFSVYGPGQNLENKMQGMVSIYLSYMLENAPLVIRGSRERFRDFVYIDDVIDAWLACFNNPIAYGKIYNVGSGERTKVKDLIICLKAIFGRGYPVKYAQGTPGDQFGVVANIRKIKRELKWKPRVGLRDGLDKMVSYEKWRL